jgi:MtaA/CmuA family methyltransferase
MTSLERLHRRMRGEPVDRPPNFDIMMQFAAHYAGHRLSDYYQDYRVLVDANLRTTEAFALDIVQAISDPYRETADWGAHITFPDDDLPLCITPLLADGLDMSHLTTPTPETGRRMSDRLEAVRAFREQVGGSIPIMGWVEGALAELADLRGVPNAMMDLVDEPERLTEALERCVEVEIAFARAQVAAGADIIGLGDAVASQISPAMYERFALPYEQRIFAAVKEAGGIPRLHICGNTSRILHLMAQSGAQIIDIDWMVDMAAAAAAFAETGALVCGNFDPVRVMLQGTPEQVYQATIQCMQLGGSRSISAAGCEIPDGTPHENLHAQARALRDLGSESTADAG